jgi:hypothetical protein
VGVLAVVNASGLKSSAINAAKRILFRSSLRRVGPFFALNASALVAPKEGSRFSDARSR